MAGEMHILRMNSLRLFLYRYVPPNRDPKRNTSARQSTKIFTIPKGARILLATRITSVEKLIISIGSSHPKLNFLAILGCSVPCFCWTIPWKTLSARVIEDEISQAHGAADEMKRYHGWVAGWVQMRTQKSWWSKSRPMGIHRNSMIWWSGLRAEWSYGGIHSPINQSFQATLRPQPKHGGSHEQLFLGLWVLALVARPTGGFRAGSPVDTQNTLESSIEHGEFSFIDDYPIQTSISWVFFPDVPIFSHAFSISQWRFPMFFMTALRSPRDDEISWEKGAPLSVFGIQWEDHINISWEYHWESQKK